MEELAMEREGGNGAALRGSLRAQAMQSGAEFFGVADLRPAMDFVVAQGGEFLRRFPLALSIGVPVARGMVEPLADRANDAAARTYHYFIYEVVNRRLNAIALDLANALESQGHAAYVVPASVALDRGRLMGLFSHKLAAHLAGHGFIGKSCLVVTPRFGGRVRWATVLTDAPLPADEPAEGECGACNACVEACPVHAFTGVEFRPEDPREVRFRAEQCEGYLAHREKTIGARVCGQCVAACKGG